MPTIIEKNFINAKISVARLVFESAKVADSVAPVVNLKMTREIALEAAWADAEDGHSALFITPHINIIFHDIQNSDVLISYESKHELKFMVYAYHGFDPNKDLPADAITPYMEMAMWIARLKATQSIKAMGLASFVWSNNDGIAVRVQEDSTKKSAKKSRRKTAQKSDS